MTRYWKVGDIAKLTGLTVRTLTEGNEATKHKED